MTEARTAEQDAAKLLARRPLTRVEVRARLLRAGHAALDADRAVAEAMRRGWIDDKKLAYDWIVTRAARLGRGRTRLGAELAGRGVAREVFEAAWREAVAAGDLDVAVSVGKALSRRVRAASAWDERRYARVYNALLREGFERDDVESALAPYRDLLVRPDEDLAERTVE